MAGLAAVSRPDRPIGLAYSGGRPPGGRRGRQAVENGVLAMVVFLATETMLFAGLISAYLVLRAGAAAWPPPDQPRLPIAITALNTLVLLASAYAMQRAAGAARVRRRSEAAGWLATTAALGAAFLLVQGVEWIRLVRHGLGVAAGPYGATFYTLIGCHGLHVLAAVLTVTVLLARMLAPAGLPRWPTRLEVCRLYWHFVVVVWPVLYVLVYLR